MEYLVNNKYNLKDEDITEVVKRVKILLINSNNEILLGYSSHEYQFIGGHVEDKESFLDTVKREVKEETGIDLDIKNINPFACSIGYWKDWPEKNKNRKTEIYFYEIKTNDKPIIDNTLYTEHEKEGNFELRYIPLNKVLEVIKDNSDKYGDEHGIAREMTQLLNIYFGGKK